MKRYLLVILMIIFSFSLCPGAIKALEGSQFYGASQIPPQGLNKEKGRDPFRLPPGIKLLVSPEEKKEVNKREGKEKQGEAKLPLKVETAPAPKGESSLPSLALKAVLISERIRLAAIEDRLVTEGAFIGEEKVLEIKPDRVILGQGEKKRTIYLPQSSVPLKVEEK